jgi:hypothetical protein
MNVDTLTITSQEALKKLDQYRGIKARQRSAEDDKVEAMYRSISKGARVVNVATAFKQAGLNEKGQPRLAIARADWPTVHFHPRQEVGSSWWAGQGNGGFSAKDAWHSQNRTSNLSLPRGVFDDKLLARNPCRSAVPHIPPDCRPRFALNNYHILFEVKRWEEYPTDPFLLRRIAGMLFIVEAEWDLSPLEAELLASLR